MAEDLLPSPHPLTPPRSEDDWVTWFRLLRSRRVGPTTFHRLLAEHGSAEAALAALPEVARTAGVENYECCPVEVAEAELRAGRLAGAVPVALGSLEYPALLSELPDAPPFLWTLGDRALLSRPLVALVGARNASSLGTRMARKLAEGLVSNGFAVVSGLARGIDTAAHMASLEGGTVAVMGGGVDVVYPAENAVLAQEIAEKGLRISEQAMGLQPQARHFPARNRIVSGLVRAVVVVEAAARSGSLITARCALDQGREVLAVPGHPFDARASGCNMLIRDGAALARGVDDILEALATGLDDSVAADDEQASLDLDEAGPPDNHAGKTRPGRTEEAPAQRPAERSGVPVSEAERSTCGTASPGLHHAGSSEVTAAERVEPAGGSGAPSRASTPEPGDRGLGEMSRLHAQILDRLGPSPMAEDQLIRDLERSAREINPQLVILELDGKIQRQPGGLLSLVP